MTLHIGCSPITGVIYAGPAREIRDGIMEWTGKRTEVTEECVNSVISHLHTKLMEAEKEGNDIIILSGKYPDGTRFELRFKEMKEVKKE